MDYTQLPYPKNNLDAQLRYIASEGATELPTPKSTTEAYMDFIARMLVDKFSSVITVVPQLPAVGEEDIIYVAPNTDTETDNLYAEYMWIDGKWEKVGSAMPPITIDWGQINNIPQYFPIDTSLDYDWTGKQTINGQDIITQIEVTNTTTSDTPSLTFTKVGNKYNVEIAFPKTLNGEAINITYDNTTSGLTSDNVQDVIDEIVGLIPILTDLINDNAPSLNTTYSSQKIEELISNIQVISNARDVNYDDTNTQLGATNVQDMLELLFNELKGLIDDNNISSDTTFSSDKILELIEEIKSNVTGVTGNTFEVLNSQWQLDSPSNMYKYTLEHNLGTQKFILDAYTINTKEKATIPVKIIDNNNIELFIENPGDIKINIIVLSNISPTGSNGEVFKINSQDWVQDLDNNYKYTLQHNLDSEDILVDTYFTDTKEKATTPIKILDNNNIEIITNTPNNLTVNISLVNTDNLSSLINIQEKTFNISPQNWVQDVDPYIYKYTLEHNLNAMILECTSKTGNEPFYLVKNIIDNNNIEFYTTEQAQVDVKLIYEVIK